MSLKDNNNKQKKKSDTAYQILLNWSVSHNSKSWENKLQLQFMLCGELKK